MRYLSLCSGIEAASVAWEPLGWEPVAALERYWPNVPNLGDLTLITAERIAELGLIDVVIGGTPCQDLSVAGQRKGIDGDRSSLFFDFVRIFDAARRFCGARWCIWENVPGAFGLNDGRDFARVVGTLAGCEIAAPVDGWGSEGVALGERGLVEWAVLDAQWFDVAQRRARLFAVLDSGNWSGRSPVLLEPESVRGDSPPRREAGARAAGTLTRSALDGSSACGGDGRDGLMVASTLTKREAKGPDSDATTTLIASTLAANSGRQQVEQTYVAGPLLSSSAGGGWRSGAEEAAMNHIIPWPPEVDGGHPGSNPPGRRKEDDENIVAETHCASYGVCYNPNACDGNDCWLKRQPAEVIACFDETQITHRENRSTAAPHTAALAASARPPAIASSVAVRRLTPRECERLQGFPDDFTLLDGKTKDSPRYAALGNSMAVPVIRWIGKRIMLASKVAA